MKEIKWTPKIRKTLTNISKLPQDQFDQGVPVYRGKNIPCCFGAHFAKEFDLKEEPPTYEEYQDYSDGLWHLANELGLTRKELDICFADSGATDLDRDCPHETFEGERWELTHHEVITNFLKLKYVPDYDDTDCDDEED